MAKASKPADTPQDVTQTETPENKEAGSSDKPADTPQEGSGRTIAEGIVNVERISNVPKVKDLHPGLTRIKIGYPDGYKGARFFKDGDVKPVSKEAAEQFVKQGIATII